MSPTLSPVLAVLLVAVGGGIGALVRHVVTTRSRTPVHGTLVVNVLGSVALGVLVGLGSSLPPWVLLLLGTGLCGAVTTWSTLAVQTWEWGSRSRARAAAYLVVSVVLGVCAAALGFALASALV